MSYFRMARFYSNNPTLIRHDGTLEGAILSAERTRKQKGINAFLLLCNDDGGWSVLWYDKPKTDTEWKKVLLKPKRWKEKIWQKNR